MASGVRFAPLFQAYYEHCYDSDEPDEMRCPLNIYMAISDKIKRDMGYRLMPPQFLGARVVFDRDLQPNTVKILNSKHPDDPKYNGTILITAGEENDG